MISEAQTPVDEMDERDGRDERAGVMSPESRRDAQLRFCVVVDVEGRALLHYFRSPQDAEGIAIRLTPKEREELAHALSGKTGARFLLRDDSARLAERIREMEAGR